GSLAAPQVSTAPVRRWQIPLSIFALSMISSMVTIWWLHRTPVEKPQDALVVEPLTSLPGLQSHPSFSPNGDQVAFLWQKPGESETDFYIKLVGPGDPIKISSGAGQYTSPEWSPDGSMIAYLNAVGPKHDALVIVPALGGPQRTVTEYASITFPCWSQDSQ